MGLKDFINKLLGKTEEVGKKAGEYSEQLGSELKEKAGPMKDKLQSTAEDLGKQVLETGKTVSEKAGKWAEDIGNQILHGDKTSDPPGSENDPLSDDEPRRKSSADKSTSEKETFTPREDPFKKYEDSHKTSTHMEELTKDDPLRTSGSFFERAQQFADGNYHGDKPKVENSDQSDTEEEKKPWTDPVAGFEDGDGDGDPVIDDAIIDEEE